MTAQASPIPSAYELRMKQANVIRKFFNKMQRQAMAIAAHDEYIVASVSYTHLTLPTKA